MELKIIDYDLTVCKVASVKNIDLKNTKEMAYKYTQLYNML